jgi:aldehyde:ferredoxin oxidoreductase
MGTAKWSRSGQEAVAELFEGDNVLDILKRREIHHHLANGAKRVCKTAGVLQDIVAKTA